MTLRDVNITINDNGFGGVGNLNDNLIAVLGTASAGTNYAAVTVTNPGSVYNDATWGQGPLPEAIVYDLSVGSGSTVIGVKVPTTTAGAVRNAATAKTITGATSATPIVITAVAHGLVTGDVTVIASVGGNTAANGTFKVTKLTADTFSLDGSVWVSGAYTSGGTSTANGTNEIATGTSVITVGSTIVDTYQFKLLVVTGGTIGATGIEFKISYDGGETYGPVLALGTATTYATGKAGTLTFAAGTLVAGDYFTYTTTEPLWAVADVLTAIDTIVNSTDDPVGFHIVGKIASADFASISTKLATLESTNKRYTFAVTNARDYTAGETDAAWVTSIEADFAASQSTRILVAAGFYCIPQQSTGGQQRRPLSWPLMGRALQNALQVSPARVKDGGLLGVTAPTDLGQVYHDERNNPGLTNARFCAAKTILGKPGWFIDLPNMMAAPGSTLGLLMYRRGMDKACRIVRATMLDYLSSEVRIDATTGHILEVDAATIEAVLNSALNTGLVNTGNVSAAVGHVSRTDNLLVTSTLNVTINVVPLAYLSTINAVIGFINPLLSPV